MIKRLLILGCCAFTGFALGRWLSPLATARASKPPSAAAQFATPAPQVELPAAERAGRVPFSDLYHALRSSRTEEQRAYLHSIQQLPEGPDRRAALKAFFQCLASISPQDAALLIPKSSTDDIERAVMAILGAAAAADAPFLVKMLLELPAEVDANWRAGRIRGQMFYWAAFDPAAALQFADQYQSIYPGLAASGIIQCLAAADPAAAERWLNQHPDLKKLPAVMSDYIQGLYQNDPAIARRFVTEHANDSAIVPSLKGVARFTFLRSADDALEFVRQLPAREARRAALDGIVDTNLDLFVTAENGRSALCAGLAEWVTKFPPEDWPNLMSAFLHKWRTLDPDGSVSWMAKLPSPTRSAIAGEFVRDLGPTQMKGLLGTTTGDFHRELLTAFSKNLPSDSEERDAAIKQLELTPEEAAQLAR